jgi:hypothetical protein
LCAWVSVNRVEYNAGMLTSERERRKTIKVSQCGIGSYFISVQVTNTPTYILHRGIFPITFKINTLKRLDGLGGGRTCFTNHEAARRLSSQLQLASVQRMRDITVVSSDGNTTHIPPLLMELDTKRSK